MVWLSTLQDQTDQKIAGCPSSIFVDVSATYNVGSHLVANSLDLQVGDLPTDNIVGPFDWLYKSADINKNEKKEL